MDSKSNDGRKENAFESTYMPMDSQPVLFRSANIYDGLGQEFLNYDLLIADGKIIEMGSSLSQPGIEVIDASNKWITPGIIDIHSHMGVYSAPSVTTSSDGNEATAPVTAEVWAEHSVWTQDPQFALALKGGVTSFHVLPGSANLFGGRGATFKNISQKHYSSYEVSKCSSFLKNGMRLKILKECMATEGNHLQQEWEIWLAIEVHGLTRLITKKGWMNLTLTSIQNVT